jgi:CHAD domain-containing protein
MQNRKPTRVVRTTSHRQSSGGGAAREVTVTIALRQYIQRLQRSLDRTLLGLSRAVTPDTVHRTRTAARRLRAVLCAFRRELNPAALHRYAAALQKLAHDLDAMREADVAQQAISILSQEHAGEGRDQLNGLKSAVVRNRSRTVCALESAIGTDTWTARLVKLRYVASDPGLIVETQEPMSSMTQRVLKRRRRRLRAALRYRGHASRRLHKLRLKIKTLRYLLEQCESTYSGVACAEVKQLRELQDCLGDLHDAWCLRRALKRHWRYPRATTELSADIETRQTELFHSFRKHRKELRRLWRAARNTE